MFFSKLCFQRQLSRFFANYSTDLNEVLHRSLSYNLQGIEQGIFFVQLQQLRNKKRRELFTKLFIFFLSFVPYLVNGLNSNTYFFFTSDNPVRNPAVNVEAPFFRGTAGNDVVMTEFWIFSFENFTKSLSNMYLRNNRKLE